MTRTMRNVLLVVSLSLGLVLAPAAPASADGGRDHGAEVTSGRFVALPGGVDLAVRGHATMVRLGSWTLVGVHIRGLDGGATYPTHVHNKMCVAPDYGGSHYQHTVGGAVDGENEIWPTVTTNRRGNGLGFAVHANRARPEAMSIVVHHPDTGVRLACVDLS